MKERSISAGSLAIRYKNQLVYQQGYGWSDKKNRFPVKPDALFRIASLTKPVTAAAVQKLIKQGKISLNTKVISYLQLTPASGKTSDPLSRQITVKHLIYHKSGWEGKTYDPTWDAFKIARKLRLPKVPDATSVARYALDSPFHFKPGTKYAYANINYLLLGLVIEKASGKDYFSFLQDQIFKPNGISRFFKARTLKKYQQAKEVYYRDSKQKSWSEFDLTGRKQLPLAYGGFKLERILTWGGLVTSASAYAQFMEHYSKYGAPNKRGELWSHTGKLPGASTIAVWNRDGMKVTAFFNQSKDSSGLEYKTINGVLDQAVKKYRTNN